MAALSFKEYLIKFTIFPYFLRHCELSDVIFFEYKKNVIDFFSSSPRHIRLSDTLSIKNCTNSLIRSGNVFIQ